MVRSALAKPPGPVVSWPMQPKRGGMVSSQEPRGQPADAQLHEHEGRAGDRRLAVGRAA